MCEKQQEQIVPQKAKLLAAESLRHSDHSGWFEVLYAEASGDASQVPWASLAVHPYLHNWLERYLPNGEGRSALVIGCGLGDDAQALQERGFKVTAFDISPTGIAWCQKRFPDSPVNYLVADLFALPQKWHGAFDFVFESRTIQALPLSVRSKVIESIGLLVAVEGTLLVLSWFRHTDTEPEGPPWPVSERELAQFQTLGFQEIRRDFFVEDEIDTVTQLWVEYLNI